MAKEQKETIQVDRNQMQEMLDRMNKQDKLIEELQKSKGKSGVETTFDRHRSGKMKIDTPVDKKINIVDEPATIDEDASQMKYDCCPYCEKFNPKPKDFSGVWTILDPTTGGKFSCRRCGKYWLPESFEEGLHGQMRVYSKDLEMGNMERVEEKERIMLARNEQIMVKEK